MRWMSLAAVIAGAVITAIGFVVLESKVFFVAWLFSTMFVFSFLFGSLGFRILHQFILGGWGDAVVLVFCAAIKTLLFMLLLVAVVILGMDYIYFWVDLVVVIKDPILFYKASYFGLVVFILWIGVYFVVYLAIAIVFERARKRGEIWLFLGFGLVLYVLVISFYVIDFGMLVDLHWYSMIYLVIVIVGYGIAALSLALLVLSRWIDGVPMGSFHDLGKLFFVFIMLWGYTVFLQFFIIWSGNLVEEVLYYIERIYGGWEIVSLVFFFFGFVVLFVGMFFREVKRNIIMMGFIVSWLIAIRLFENAWMVLFFYEGCGIIFFDFGVLFLLGGVWSFIFFCFFDRGDA